MKARVLALLLSVLAALLVVPAPAQASARVSIDAAGSGAAIDASYSTTLTVSGRGFQSVRGGHGGIYVWFGTASGSWRPSKGGVSGEDYVYVPDGEARANQGFQRFVAFPGSDTADSANGGTMSETGDWSAELLVPGPVFEAVGRNGTVRTVDCRRVTCGVITVGAHGVKNATNETFTPVVVKDLYGESGVRQGAARESGTGGTAGTAGRPGVAGSDESERPSARGRPRLAIDRDSARAGHVLAFSASNLVPGEQVSVVLDDGLAASGPFVVGDTGQLAGVVSLPADLGAGTHELRLFGVDRAPSVRFAAAPAAPGLEGEPEPGTLAAERVAVQEAATAPRVFLGVAAGILLASLLVTVVRLMRRRRASA
ncbi:hypothetical protein [Nocardioides pacificus]